jgi:hypothetical protein
LIVRLNVWYIAHWLKYAAALAVGAACIAAATGRATARAAASLLLLLRCGMHLLALRPCRIINPLLNAGGYIYDGKEAFDKLPNSYRCPVCNAPKRR